MLPPELLLLTRESHTFSTALRNVDTGAALNVSLCDRALPLIIEPVGRFRRKPPIL